MIRGPLMKYYITRFAGKRQAVLLVPANKRGSIFQRDLRAQIITEGHKNGIDNILDSIKMVTIRKVSSRESENVFKLQASVSDDAILPPAGEIVPLINITEFVRVDSSNKFYPKFELVSHK
jgi:hypothetical protein